MLSKIVKKCQIVKYYRKNVKLSKVKSFGGPSSKVLVCQKEKIKVPGVYLMVPGGYLLAPGGYLMVPEGYLNKGVILSCSGQLKMVHMRRMFDRIYCRMGIRQLRGLIVLGTD